MNPISAAGRKRQPIGIFDSGIGGLTVMSEVIRLLPGEDIVYFGDTARVPYGSKSQEAVTRFSLEIASFLIDRGVKLIVVACNTASAFALGALRRKLDIPVLGVIEPGAKAALSATRSARIGVIGTEGTVRSSSYLKAIRGLDAGSRVFSQACPLFVPLIEEGWLEHPVTRRVAREYLSSFAGREVDTLVLGCTHYPLIKKVIGRTVGSGIRLIDSAAATAVEVKATLDRHDLLSDRKGPGRCRFFVSDAPLKFQLVGQKFLGRRVAPVKKIVLGQERSCVIR